MMVGKVRACQVKQKQMGQCCQNNRRRRYFLFPHYLFGVQLIDGRDDRRMI